MRLRVVVEGEGDRKASPVLLGRVTAMLGAKPVQWDPIVMGSLKGRDLESAVEGMLDRLAAITEDDDEVDGALILLDADYEFGGVRACPASDGPVIAALAARRSFRFPVACVLAFQEFESWFLPCVICLADHPWENRSGEPHALFDRPVVPITDPESRRDAKNQLSARMPSRRTYKATLDQDRFAQVIHLDHAEHGQAEYGINGCSSFGTLRRCVEFLVVEPRGGAMVYPPPSEADG